MNAIQEASFAFSTRTVCEMSCYCEHEYDRPNAMFNHYFGIFRFFSFLFGLINPEVEQTRLSMAKFYYTTKHLIDSHVQLITQTFKDYYFFALF